MFIVSKDRDVVINMDNVTNIYIENGNNIMARAVDSEEILLGRYINCAYEIFADMLQKAFPPATLIFQNCMPDKESISAFKDKVDLGAIVVSDATDRAEVKMYDCGVYYMPEE